MSISKRMRFEIFKRDNFTCVYCGRRPPSVTLEVDHRIPVSKGGGDEIGNLVSACWDCNRGKGPVELRDDADALTDGLDALDEFFTGGIDKCPDELPRWFADTRGRRHHLSKEWNWQSIAELDGIPAKPNWLMTPVKVLALAEAFDTVEVI